MDIFNKSDVLNYINEHNKEHGGHLTTESGFKKNPNLTETDVMHSRGFWKCWDSGKIKFIKKR